MSDLEANSLFKQFSRFFKPHPWHGIDLKAEGDHLQAYIEMVPTDTVKYEIDKSTGYLKVDRPQKYSNIIPALYGFLPKTYSGALSAEYAESKSGLTDLKGDGDPIDICVLTEKNFTHGDIILSARPIGGFRMLDGGEIDDKIIAVLKDDPLYGEWTNIGNCPKKVVDRLLHYFLTYKEIPGSNEDAKVRVTHIYEQQEAREVIRAGVDDYRNKFGF